MQAFDRKAAVAAYKERKAAAGIYVLTCRPTGQKWVGRAPDLASIHNRLWFTLSQGSSLQVSLQAAWWAHGSANFTFEEVERLAEEDLVYARDRLLKDRLAHWASALAAAIV